MIVQDWERTPGMPQYLHADNNVQESMVSLMMAYYRLGNNGGVMENMKDQDQAKLKSLMFLAFLDAHGIDYEQFNKRSGAFRERFLRQFAAWKAIMEAYIGFGYLNPKKAMQIDIMEMVVHGDADGKIIQTVGLLPAQNDKPDLGLPTLDLYDIPEELQARIDALVKEDKQIVELGRFARSGTINYVKSQLNEGSEVNVNPFPSWLERKLNDREKVYYNLRLILSVLLTLKKLGADAIIANIAETGTIYVTNAKGEQVEINLKGAGEFFGPIVDILGGDLYDATWKEEQKTDGAFSQYAKGHPTIRIAFIPEINYAKVGKVLYKKSQEFFTNKNHKKELKDLKDLAGNLEA